VYVHSCTWWAKNKIIVAIALSIGIVPIVV